MADGSGFLPPAVEAAPFKEAMSRWATGVAIASCRFEGAPHGLAISSFTSVSATPPRVLFCLAKTSRSALAFRHALEVGIALLPEDAEPLAQRFSGGAEPHARFDEHAWDLDPRAPPPPARGARPYPRRRPLPARRGVTRGAGRRRAGRDAGGGGAADLRRPWLQALAGVSSRIESPGRRRMWRA